MSTKARSASHVSKGHKATPRSRRYQGSLIIGAALCGVLIASFHWLPPVPHPAAAPIQSQEPHATINGPAQSDPLFAAQPAWAQTFQSNTATLDNSSWSAIIGQVNNSNQEQQYYTDNAANLRVQDGALQLVATYNAAAKDHQYQSARIETQGKKSFLYGRLDVTAKLPRGSGTWPAIWLLPATSTYANLSPASDPNRYRNGGEIDIMEAVGFQPTVVYGVAHTLSDVTEHPDKTGSYNSIAVPHNDATFNTYTLLWTPTTLTYEINGSPYYTYTRQPNADYKTWPFDQSFYMIINLAMGGTWGGMDTQHYPGNGIDNSALPASLAIQSIYYYPYVGPTNGK